MIHNDYKMPFNKLVTLQTGLINLASVITRMHKQLLCIFLMCVINHM